MSKIRQSGQVLEDLEELRAKLEIIDNQIQQKQHKKEKLKASHASLLELNVGNKRPPKSLETQRRQLFNLEAEVEGLKSARPNVEAKLQTLQQELHRARLYESDVSAYHKADAAYGEKLGEIMETVEVLQSQINTFVALATDFVENSTSPLYLLSGIINGAALASLSLPKFLQGEVAKEQPGENDLFIQQLAQKYSEDYLGLPQIESFEALWNRLSGRLQLTNHQAQSLIPRHLKYIPATEQKPEPPRNVSTSDPVTHPMVVARAVEARKETEQRNMEEWRRFRSG